MDQNNDWYERYSSPGTQDSGARAPRRREPRGVRYSTLVVFMLVAVLLGGVLGGLYTRQYVGEQLTALAAQQSAASEIKQANAASGSAGLTNTASSSFVP